MKRLSIISVGLGVLLAGTVNARADSSELWDDMVLTAYGAPDSERGTAQADKGEARGDKGEAQDAAQDQAQQGQQAQGAQADQGQAQEDKGDARADEGAALGDKGEARADENAAQGDKGEAQNEQDASQAQQERQQEQQAQQGQQEQVSKPQRGKLFIHDEGTSAGDALNPNLEPLSYFLGFWNCTANVTDANGVAHTFDKSVYYKSVFGGNWVAAAWGKGSGGGNGGSTGGDQNRYSTTHHNIGGAASEGYNPFSQEFVNVCITHTGGYGYATSPGWDANDNLVWTGEAWNVHGQAHIFKQVTITKTDSNDFKVDVATGTDGVNYNSIGTATCTRGQHPHGR